MMTVLDSVGIFAPDFRRRARRARAAMAPGADGADAGEVCFSVFLRFPYAEPFFGPQGPQLAKKKKIARVTDGRWYCHSALCCHYHMQIRHSRHA